MTALSVCIWASGVVCGLDSDMDGDELSDYDGRISNTY